MNFPKLSKTTNEKSKLATRLQLRSFGCTVEDLGINFNVNSPTLVTQLIRFCTVVTNNNDVLPNENFYWSLELGKRIECLIRISLSETSPYIVTVLKCLEVGCGKYLELSLSFKDLFPGICKSEVDTCSLILHGKNIILRKPTGFDQLSWLDIDSNTQVESAKSIITTLLNNADEEVIHEIKMCSNEIIEQIGERLAAIDPLIDYKIELECPICRIKNIYRIDLEKLLLKKLSGIQRELLYTIHALATNYHWTENEILAIPASRRRLYISAIESEKS